MKRMKLISIVILLALCLNGCSSFNSGSDESNTPSGVPKLNGFVTIKSTDIHGGDQALSKEYIIYDEDTKVEYMIISTSDNKISMTPLYNADGKPKIYKEKR